MESFYEFFVNTKAIKYYSGEYLFDFVFLHPLQQDYYIFDRLIIFLFVSCDYFKFLKGQKYRKINVLINQSSDFIDSLRYNFSVLMNDLKG